MQAGRSGCTRIGESCTRNQVLVACRAVKGQSQPFALPCRTRVWYPTLHTASRLTAQTARAASLCGRQDYALPPLPSREGGVAARPAAGATAPAATPPLAAAEHAAPFEGGLAQYVLRVNSTTPRRAACPRKKRRNTPDPWVSAWWLSCSELIGSARCPAELPSDPYCAHAIITHKKNGK